MTETKSRACYNQASRYLARRAHSVAELKRKLALKGFAEPEIGETIHKLLEYGYLDDEAYCRSYAAGRAARLKLGPAKVRHDLVRKGFGAELISSTLAELYEDDDAERRMALEAARAKLASLKPGMDERVAKRKLYEHLTRKGFSAETARRVALDDYDDIMAERKAAK